MGNKTVQSVASRSLGEPVIEIAIRSNRTHSGKTFVAEVIRRALAAHGITAEIESAEGHPDFDVVNGTDAFVMAGEYVVSRGVAVKIIDNNERI